MTRAGSRHADLVLKDATVLTVDALDRTAGAVAVRDGVIVAVGGSSDVEGLIGPRTRVLALPGRTVVPGLIDAHTHNTFIGEFRYTPRQLPWFWGDQHIREFIGGERARRMVPARAALDLGLAPCAHSDCPVCTPDDPVWPSNPLWGMACAATRKTRSGADIGPEQRVTPLEALRMYTINGARASFEESIKGSIEVGKVADLAVLGGNPLAVEPWAIKDIAVEQTIIGGEIAFDAERDG